MADSKRRTSLFFSEIMKGYISLGDTDVLTGYRKALLAGAFIETFLNITAEDLNRFLEEPDHSALPAGTIKWPAMGGDLAIEGGVFQLFVATDNAYVKRLNYQLYVTGSQGPLTISGFKTLTDNPTAGIWFDTSTLWTKIFTGHISVADSVTATPIGAGIINLYKFDFLKVVLSFRIIRQAQARYTKLLVNTVPPGVHAILDVGCGVGCNARALTEKGYKVTSISPDGNHGKFFQNAPEPLRFCQSKYENFSSDERFDLVLMSESQNYFDADTGLSQTRRLLTPGGYLLICGMFRKKNTPEFDQVPNAEQEKLST